MFETLKYPGCELTLNPMTSSITIRINNSVLLYDEKNKPVFDSTTGETVIEYTGLATDKNPACSWAKATYRPNGSSPAHHHKNNTEDYYIVSGQATVIIDNVSRILGPGEHIRIEPKQIHQVINESSDKELILIVKCVPAWTINDFHLDAQPANNNIANRL